MKNDVPNTAIVLFSSGAFGGAEKRFTNLFVYLSQKHPGKFYLVINHLLSNHLERVFPGINRERIIVVGESSLPASHDKPNVYNDKIQDPYEADKKTSFIRKVYWYFRNRQKQKKIFNEIDEIRSQNKIDVFVGIFAGILPLVFYFKIAAVKPAVIFSDMDSWFSEIMPDKKKFWYRKYYSFNYALESADHVDFLSPYIEEGVRIRNVNIDPSKSSVAPCSFINYSKCSAGKKESMEIAFASRMEPDKNPMLYLEAVKVISKTHPEVKFHLLGEGSLVNEIEEFITSNDLQSSVRFRFHPNPPEVFSVTSVFVSLQSGTNYPSQSMIEAMACGNAVIASNTGDTALLVNEKNGDLIDLNLDGLVAALLRRIENKEETIIKGRNAREFVLNTHTIERYSEYFVDMLKTVHKKNLSDRNTK